MEPSTAAAADSPSGGATAAAAGDEVEPESDSGVDLGGATTSSGSRRFAGKSAVARSRDAAALHVSNGTQCRESPLEITIY